jgi:hypothetical protein
MAKQHHPPCPCSSTATGSPRKSSDTSSSESTSVTGDEYGCGSFIINFLHLRSNAVDAVVDDTANKAEDADVGMMEQAEMDMALQDDDDDAGDTPLETTQPATSSTNCSSPSPKDIQGKTQHLGTKTQVLPPKSIDIVDIWNQSSIDLSMPKLSKSSPPESLPQTHLISGTAGNTIDEDSPSSLSFVPMNHTAVTQFYGGMMSNIPRIHLRMRNSRQTVVHRVTEDVDQSKKN